MKRRGGPSIAQTSRRRLSERPRTCWSTSAAATYVTIMFVAIGSWSIGAFVGFWLRGWRDRQPKGGTAACVTKNYLSFEEYATDMLGSAKPLPVPIVTPSSQGSKGAMALPAGTIIGVQKGGTMNLRAHLLQHPLLSGMPGKEAHFFDRRPGWYPSLGEWPGDGLDMHLNPEAAGSVIFEYANASMQTVNMEEDEYDGSPVTVESSPMYMFYPLAPFRMAMVQPHAKLVVVLKDPTARYFSQVRMAMCTKRRDGTGVDSNLRPFHAPGRASGYLNRASAKYSPYNPLCRGVKATANDLLECFRVIMGQNPLFRGLYAEQLERWFRVFDRSQILVLDSSEMLGDFPATLGRVAAHLGLPPHTYTYDPRHQHSSGACSRERPEYFAEDGRYGKMLKDEALFREWYRPHNQRLYALIGRDLGWD